MQFLTAEAAAADEQTWLSATALSDYYSVPEIERDQAIWRKMETLPAAVVSQIRFGALRPPSKHFVRLELQNVIFGMPHLYSQLVKRFQPL